MKDLEEKAEEKLRILGFEDDMKQGIWLSDLMAKFAKKEINSALQEAAEKNKHKEKINNIYGAFFDKVISDGQNPEEAAHDLGLL